MYVYTVTNETENSRVRWVHDEGYQTVGSYAYDTEEETREAENYEIEQLSTGNWVALGAVVETRCPTCNQWGETDSLWGIVVPIDEDLESYAKSSLALPQS